MKPLLISFPGSLPLAASLAAALPADTGVASLHRFPDGESRVRVGLPVSKRQVIVLADLLDPDRRFLPLHFLARTLREEGAAAIGLIAPYLPYLRQDHRFEPGEAESARLFAELLSRDFDWLATVDPHLHRIRNPEEVFAIPVAVTHAAPLMADWIKTQVAAPLIVGPDDESVQWVEAVAKRAGAPFVVLSKTRHGDHAVEIELLPEATPRDRTPVLVDDVISTGRTLIAAAARLREAGCPPPVCVAVHGVFAGDALAALAATGITQVATCNTIAHPTNVMDVSGLLAAAIAPLIDGY